eukprot:UN00526
MTAPAAAPPPPPQPKGSTKTQKLLATYNEQQEFLKKIMQNLGSYCHNNVLSLYQILPNQLFHHVQQQQL